MPDIANPFFLPLIQAAQMEADRSDFCIFLGNTESSNRKTSLSRFAGQVEGLVLASHGFPTNASGPCSTTAARADQSRHRWNSACSHRQWLRRGARSSTRKARLSQDRLCQAGPQTSWSNKQRRNAIRTAAASAGIAVEIVAASLLSYNSGRNVVDAILSTGADSQRRLR